MAAIRTRWVFLLGGIVCISVPALGATATPGKYRGRVGTTAVIAFDVSDRSVTNIHAGILSTCQNTRGWLTRKLPIAVRLGKKRVKIGANGVFAVKGRWDKNTSYTLKGKFDAAGKASGTFQASRFIFNVARYSSELCQSRFPWKAAVQ